MTPTTALIIDIETCHDKDLMQRLQYCGKEGAFPSNIYHLPCAIAIGALDGEGVLLKVESLENDQCMADSSALTEAFWQVVERSPLLISFNGRRFDLPVMELCSLRYGTVAANHWQAGSQGRRYRYGSSHLDLLDVLTNFGGIQGAGYSLTNLVQMLGYRGKEEIDGSSVQALYESGQIEAIRAYNRLDVIRTYALWLHWALMAGRLTPAMYQAVRLASKPWLEQIALSEG